MPPDHPNFHYIPTEVVPSENSFIARLKKGISNKETLLSELNNICKFPDYFSFNFDALYDCLCDFSWIKSRYICLLHSDVPLMNIKALCKSYLDLLNDAANQWEDDERRLLIFFPDHAQKTILSVWNEQV
jgi:RNAse (barnase) inhibitor barstar